MNTPDEKVKRMEARFWRHVDKDGPVPAHRPELGPCWVWTAGTSNGYGSIAVPNEANPRSHSHSSASAHRVSWELHYGAIPDGLFVCHHCDVRVCVRPDHFFLGTNADNMRDMREKGRAAKLRGPDSPLWKSDKRRVTSTNGRGHDLHSHLAMLIKHRYAQGGVTMKEVALTYGVAISTVSVVVSGKRWAEVEG